MLPKLPACPPFGPGSTEHLSEPLPADYQQAPLNYLPPPIVLTEQELDLAGRYEQGDFSGGYVASQIASFRRGLPAEQHDERREALRAIEAEVARLGLCLPPAYVALLGSDDAMNRLRHDDIWLLVPDRLVALPTDPRCQLLLAAWEGQGLGYWYLLLAPDGSHAMAFCKEAFGNQHFNFNRQIDPADYRFWQCAASFDEWIVRYFQACVRCDQHSEALLERAAGTIPAPTPEEEGR